MGTLVNNELIYPRKYNIENLKKQIKKLSNIVEFSAQ